MTSSSQLAIAYIAKSPQSASRVLTSVPPEEAAAFVNDIPVAQAASLIACSTPLTAARIIKNVEWKLASAIFSKLDLGQASAIVRQMDRGGRSAFLSKLPKRSRTALEKVLAFPPDTIGAHMTATINTLLESDSVATALDLIRQSDHGLSDAVFVLNEAGRLSGIVSSATALRHPGATRLSTIMDVSCPEVTAHARLDTLADTALWESFSCLPVVNRQRVVIGAISRKSLALARGATTAGLSQRSESVPASVFGALVTTTAGLLRLLSPPVSGALQRRSGNDR